MSFSGTPLGQGRRLDHQTFLKGGPFTNKSQAATGTSPPRRTAAINSVPLSYAYGAPTLGTGSPNKSGSPSASPNSRRSQTVRTEEGTDDDDSLLSRYAQLKQRNQVLANRPGSSLGPGTITTPPQPTPATLKDTSVNIASAFHQAASTYTMQNNINTSSSWTSSRANLPRSTSVEYEKEAQSTSHRRLAVPPGRANARTLGGSKPPSKVGSTRGSDIENEHSGEATGVNGRAKSPFDQLADLTRRAMAPATFLMRQRSQEPESVRPPSRQATDATLVAQNNNSGSYDYAEEEEEFQQMQKSSKRNSSAAHKRNRMSTDNKAYRPTASDLEEESEDDLDDERKGRRRKKKKEVGGGPLNTLPVTTYDKRRKRRSRAGKGGEGTADEDGSASDNQEERVSDHHSIRSNTPLQRQASVPRGSVPPESRVYNMSGPTDESADIEQGLDSIPEADELNISPSPEREARKEINRARSRPRSRSRSRVRSSPAFSIGAFLGSFVNMLYRFGHGVVVFIFRMLAMMTLLFGRVMGTVFDLFIRQPFLIVRRGRAVSHLGKYAVVGVGMYVAWYALRHPSLANLGTSPMHPRPYTPSEYPAATVEELGARLLQLENILANVQANQQSERDKFDSDLRKAHEFAYRIGQLESRIDKEFVRAQRLEEDSRSATFKGLESLQREIRTLQTQQAERPSRPDGPSADEEARAKLRVFENRLDSVEGGIKEALELGQTAVKAGSVAAAAIVANPGSSWWNKLGTGSGSAITIKSSDGQDVSSLIGQLIEKAVTHHRKDDLALTDFALGSGGAAVIPSLTSPTLEIRQSYFYGFISGQSLFARSPATALHHDTHLGYCWPFAGSRGQLGVTLAAPVRITDITIDHVARENAHDLRPAPRYMEVWGLVEGADNLEKFRTYKEQEEEARQVAEEEGRPFPEEPAYPETLPKKPAYMRIASFMYDVNAPSNIQTFPVLEEVRELGIDFGLVVLMINDNWGHNELTCLYRFRVHGSRVQELPAPGP